MRVRSVLLTVSYCLIGSLSHAEDIKTTYSIGSSAATVTTVVKQASSKREDLMRAFPFDTVAKALRRLPTVTGIDYNSDVPTEETTSNWQDYFEIKRKYPVMVHLNLPTSITMMMKVEESYRRCKSPAEKPPESAGGSGRDRDDSVGGTAVDCSLQASLTVRGPYTVYGNFASAISVDELLREKQYMRVDISRDGSDKTSLKIDSRFYVDSDMFDKNLYRFLNAFNLSVAAPPRVDALAGGDTGQALFTRSNILLGIARIMRVNNEKVVEL